jgi:hypothetical protein
MIAAFCSRVTTTKRTARLRGRGAPIAPRPFARARLLLSGHVVPPHRAALLIYGERPKGVSLAAIVGLDHLFHERID